MAQRPWNSILTHIHSLAARHDNPACDAELLDQFVSHRDEAAFEALFRRHGPMVLRVARRIVGNEADAEDVFQATFLLLARRAAAIRKRESVASWLHGVAHRLALSAVRRQQRENEAIHRFARNDKSAPDSAWSDLEATLHEVLAQLPEKYRTPLVHCYLEGWTQEEVARQLGKPLGTVRSWLARGRELLRKRLLRRGISLSTEGASAALLASACASAEAVPPTLRLATLQAVHLFAKGGNVMTVISPAVAALVRQGTTAMLTAKIKSGAVWVLALALLAGGSGWAAHRTFSAKVPEANEIAEKDAPPQAAAEEHPRADAFGDPLPPGAVARLGTVCFCQESRLQQFAISPDRRTLAATAGKSVAFWDIATGRLTQRFTFRWDMYCLAFAPDGKSLAVAGEDRIVYLFDSASGKELRRFVGHKAGKDRHFDRGVFQAFFTPDGRTLLTQGSDETVRFWDARSGKELRQIDARKWDIWNLSADGKFLAVKKSGEGKTLHLLDAATGKEVRQLNHSAEAGTMAFSPDGKSLAVACGTVNHPGRITLWELESGKELGTLVGHLDAVFALAFSADGKLLTSAGYGKMIRLWDLASQKELREPMLLPTPVYQLAFTRDSKTLLSSGFDNHVHLWDVATGRERFAAHGPSGAIAAITYSPDGKRMACASSNKIWLWTPASGKVLRTLEGHEGTVSALCFSADEKSLISGSYDGMLRFFDPTTGKEQKSFGIGNGWIQEVALSPDGKMLAVWGESTERKIQLLHASTGAKLRTIEVPSEQPGVIAIQLSLRFSADGKTLYGCNGNHVSILRWDAATGKALPLIGKHDGGLRDIAVSPDGRSVAVASMGGSVYLWETATGQTRFVTKGPGLSDAIAFSPDGRLLAVVNTGNSRLHTGNEIIPQGIETREQVRIVRVGDGKVICRFSGHLGGIRCLSFSPDGRTLASGGLDSTVLVWDVTKLHKESVKDKAPPTTEKLAELWQGLLGTAAEAHVCMWTLIAAPGQAVPFLSEKLKPVAVLDAERFARLVKQLESDQFAEREQGTQELKTMGASIEPALRKFLQEKPPVESRRRLQALLDDLEGAERLRSLRAIEVLERIGDKPARDLLHRLAEGAAGAWLTEESRASLRRLEQRDK